jgi:hypothetical protein
VPYIVGAVSGGLLGLLPATSGVSMCGVIAINALIALAIHRILVPQSVAIA